MCFFLLLASLLACGNNKAKEESTSQALREVPGADSIAYYPVQQYFKSQVADVAATPYYVYEIIQRNGMRDSSKVSPEHFRHLANNFLEVNIEEMPLKKYYQENSFSDLSLKSVTFTYTALKSDLPLKSLDVLLDETGTRVTRVFMHKEYGNKDSTVMEKLGWMHDESFYINRMVEYANGNTVTEHRTVKWR